MTVEKIGHSGAWKITGVLEGESDHHFLVEVEGECDKCASSYDLSSRDNRCGDCGNCDTCCTHKGEGK